MYYYLTIRSSKARTAGQNVVEREKKKKVYFLDVYFSLFYLYEPRDISTSHAICFKSTKHHTKKTQKVNFMFYPVSLSFLKSIFLKIVCHRLSKPQPAFTKLSSRGRYCFWEMQVNCSTSSDFLVTWRWFKSTLSYTLLSLFYCFNA